MSWLKWTLRTRNCEGELEVVVSVSDSGGSKITVLTSISFLRVGLMRDPSLRAKFNAVGPSLGKSRGVRGSRKS